MQDAVELVTVTDEQFALTPGSVADLPRDRKSGDYLLDSRTMSFDGLPSIDQLVDAELGARVLSSIEFGPVRIVILVNNVEIVDRVVLAGEELIVQELVPGVAVLPADNEIMISAYCPDDPFPFPFPGEPIIWFKDFELKLRAPVFPIFFPRYRTVIRHDLKQTRVHDYATGDWVATFTNGCQTVTVHGPMHEFVDPTELNKKERVKSTTRVRLLPAPFTGSIDWAWLNAAVIDQSDDVLKIAVQYLKGVPAAKVGDHQYKGDAAYGDGADFYDYMNQTWFFFEGMKTPQPTVPPSLDCSGFVRMVYGLRCGLPMTFDLLMSALPRRSCAMADPTPGHGLGIMTIPNTEQPVGSLQFRFLAPGDLVFFGGTSSEGNDPVPAICGNSTIHHVGIYLGLDEHSPPFHRFISSRRFAKGPMFSDLGGRSILNGNASGPDADNYTKNFYAARRL